MSDVENSDVYDGPPPQKRAKGAKPQAKPPPDYDSLYV